MFIVIDVPDTELSNILSWIGELSNAAKEPSAEIKLKVSNDQNVHYYSKAFKVNSVSLAKVNSERSDQHEAKISKLFEHIGSLNSIKKHGHFGTEKMVGTFSTGEDDDDNKQS